MKYMTCSVSGCFETGQLYKKLSNLVNASIAEGWKPQGGIAITSNRHEDGYTYGFLYQAMIKDDKHEKITIKL